MANIKSYLTPRVDPILKLSITRQLRKIFTCLPHKAQKSTRFLKMDPDILHTCCMSRCRPDDGGCVYVFFLFSPKILDSLRPKDKTKKANYLAWKKKNSPPTDRQGLTEHRTRVCSKSICRKRRGFRLF